MSDGDNVADARVALVTGAHRVVVRPGRFDDQGKRVPMDVAEGDVVIFSKYGGTEVKYEGKDLLLLNARDILAVVSK